MNLVVAGLDISHAQIFAPLFQELGVKIAYVHDSDLSRAQEYAVRFGARVLTTLEEVPWTEISGALITTMASGHADAAIPFLEHKIPVYVDKQLAASFPDALRIVEAAERCGAPLLSGSVRRFSPAFRTITDYLKRGDLGEPVIVNRYEPHGVKPGDWQDKIETSGGFIVNFGIHCVDSLCAILGEDVSSVQCLGGKYIYPDAESEGTCVITVQFKSGAIGIASVFAAQQPFKATQPSLQVHGTKGTLEAFIDEGLARNYRGTPIYDPVSYNFASGNRDTVASIVEMMRTKVQPVPCRELLAVSRILAMARVSYAETRTVKSDEFSD